MELYIKSYARINIPHHINSDDTIYNVISDIELSTKFITMPFGTTRTRFQTREMFEYTLTPINNINKNKYYYTLHIKRNIKQCNPSILSLFPKTGWNSLTISNFKTTDKFDYDFIKHYIPENYGDFTTNFTETSKTIGIVVPLFGRHKYTKLFLESLINTNLDDCILVLVDESLTKNVDDDKKRTNQLIHNFNIIGVPIIKIFKQNHGNMNDSILLGLDMLSSMCKYLNTIDSDTLQKNNWVSQSIDILTVATKQFEGKPVIVSGFNTESHAIDTEYSTFYTKKSVGGCHLCFATDLYIKQLRYCLSSHKWDTNIYNTIINNNGVIISTKPSVVEHIGVTSSVRDETNLVKSIDY